jgi:hypothetical protein
LPATGSLRGGQQPGVAAVAGDDFEVTPAHADWRPAMRSSTAIHNEIQEGVAGFTDGEAQSGDITLVVLEFRGSTADH